MSGIDLSKQEARLKDNKRKPLIVIGTAKKILEIIHKDPSLVRHTKTIVIDEVDKVLLPLHRKTPFKKLTHRENHPRPAKLLVEKIFKISKVSGHCSAHLGANNNIKRTEQSRKTDQFRKTLKEIYSMYLMIVFRSNQFSLLELLQL